MKAKIQMTEINSNSWNNGDNVLEITGNYLITIDIVIYWSL